MDLHAERITYELEPGVSICETLASICRGELLSETPSVEQRPSSTPLRARGSTPQQGRSARRKQAWGRRTPTTAPPTDRPCSSDMRGYGSLEELLSTGWEKPADLTQRWAWAKETSDEIISTSSADRGSSRTPTGWSGHVAADSVSWEARPRSRGTLTAAAKASGAGPRPSEDWNVATHVATAKVEEKATQGQSRHRPPKIRALPDDATRPPRLPDDATRPPSPLLPGVYVGHGQELPVFPRKILLAFTSQNAEAAPPTFGTMTSRTRTGRPHSPTKTAGILKSPRRTRIPQKELKLKEEEDLERIAKDKERYLQWKRKVIESARNLQIEVSRFRIET